MEEITIYWCNDDGDLVERKKLLQERKKIIPSYLFKKYEAIDIGHEDTV